MVFVFDSGPFFGTFWFHFGLPNRPKFRASTDLVGLKTTKVDPWDPKMPQEAAKTPQEVAKTAQDDPQEPPKTPPRCPKRPLRPPLFPSRGGELTY